MKTHACEAYSAPWMRESRQTWFPCGRRGLYRRVSGPLSCGETVYGTSLSPLLRSCWSPRQAAEGERGRERLWKPTLCSRWVKSDPLANERPTDKVLERMNVSANFLWFYVYLEWHQVLIVLSTIHIQIYTKLRNSWLLHIISGLWKKDMCKLTTPK